MSHDKAMDYLQDVEKTGNPDYVPPKEKNAMSFNPDQLATWKEATLIARKLTEAGIGGGVRPQVRNPNASGIYLPSFLVYPPPGDKGSFFLHFRFNNGKEGFNVGLIRGQFARYSKEKVLRDLREWVEPK